MKTILKSLAIGLMAVALSGCVRPVSAFVDVLNVSLAESPTKAACDGTLLLDPFSEKVQSVIDKGEVVADAVSVKEAEIALNVGGGVIARVDKSVRADWEVKCRKYYTEAGS